MTRRKDVQFADSMRRCPVDGSPCLLLIFAIFTWQSQANVRLISFPRCSNYWKVASATEEMTQKWLKGVILSQGSSVFFLVFDMAAKAALLPRGECSEVTAHCQFRDEPQSWLPRFFFFMWTIFKHFYCICYNIAPVAYFSFFWLQGMRDLSSPTREPACTPCSRRSLNHWTTRKCPWPQLLKAEGYMSGAQVQTWKFPLTLSRH